MYYVLYAYCTLCNYVLYAYMCMCVCVYLYALESYTACKEVESYDLYEEKNPWIHERKPT